MNHSLKFDELDTCSSNNHRIFFTRQQTDHRFKVTGDRRSQQQMHFIVIRLKSDDLNVKQIRAQSETVNDMRYS